MTALSQPSSVATENTGNNGQHKATGKAGAERLANQAAMERIRKGLTGK